jgi:secondary thiamine-phosphate synthase enzyme
MGPLRTEALIGLEAPEDAVCTTPDEIDFHDEVELAERTPVIVRATIPVQTERAFHLLDVTDHAHQLVHRSQVNEGTLVVYTPHTTCAVRINERESGFFEDLRAVMEQIAPTEAYYRHDDFDIRTENLDDPATEPINGHSHIKSMLLGSSSEHVPVIGGELALGQWQRIMFIELDQSRPRRVQLQIQGWR